MNNAWDNALLEALAEILREMETEVHIAGNGGRNVLTVEYGDTSPAEDLDLSVVHLTEDSTALSILITVASGLDKRASAQVCRMLPFLNRSLSVGNFGLAEESGYFYFSYTMLLDESTDPDTLLYLIGGVMTVAEATAAQGAALAAPVIRGEMTAAERLNSASPLLQ